MTKKGFHCAYCLNTFLGQIQKTTNQWTETLASYCTCQEILDPHVTPKHNKLLRPFHASLASNKPEVSRKRVPPTFICLRLNLPKFRCSARFALGFTLCILLVGRWTLFSLQIRNRKNIFSQKHCGSGIRVFWILFAHTVCVVSLQDVAPSWWSPKPPCGGAVCSTAAGTRVFCECL